MTSADQGEHEVSKEHGQKTVNESTATSYWVRTMRDTPGDMTSTVVCPNCKAETIDHQPLDEYEYRCLQRGTTFNASGDEQPHADSDAPDVP